MSPNVLVPFRQVRHPNEEIIDGHRKFFESDPWHRDRLKLEFDNDPKPPNRHVCGAPFFRRAAPIDFRISPDARTMVKDCTKSEIVPQRGLVPWVAVATADPIEHSVRKGSDGSERPDSARKRVRSPMRTPAPTTTVFVTGSNLPMRLSPPSRMATSSVMISGPWEYPLPNARTFSPERPAAATAVLTSSTLAHSTTLRG